MRLLIYFGCFLAACLMMPQGLKAQTSLFVGKENGTTSQRSEAQTQPKLFNSQRTAGRNASQNISGPVFFGQKLRNDPGFSSSYNDRFTRSNRREASPTTGLVYNARANAIRKQMELDRLTMSQREMQARAMEEREETLNRIRARTVETDQKLARVKAEREQLRAARKNRMASIMRGNQPGAVRTAPSSASNQVQPGNGEQPILIYNRENNRQAMPARVFNYVR